jgi:hypothetical protein
MVLCALGAMTMPYLHCGNCSLQIRIQAEYLRLENCPRCLARQKTLMPLVLTASRVEPAAGWGTGRAAAPRERSV